VYYAWYSGTISVYNLNISSSHIEYLIPAWVTFKQLRSLWPAS